MGKEPNRRRRPPPNNLTAKNDKQGRTRLESSSDGGANLNPTSPHRVRRRPPPYLVQEAVGTDTDPKQAPKQQSSSRTSKEVSKLQTEYDVGYGKPPRKTRFRKGHSGNPSGRPKRARNVETMFREELKRSLPITENGRTRRLPAVQIAIRKQVHDAILGKPHASRALIDAAERYLPTDSDAAVQGLSQQDKELLKNFLGPQPEDLEKT